MPSSNFSIRLSVKDADTAIRALSGLGKEGQAALKKIERAGSPASKGLLAVRRATGELSAGMQGMAGRAGALGAALSALGPAGLAAAAGIGGAMAGIARAVRRARAAIDELDKLDDTSRKLGVTVEGLQELRFAADQTGVSQQTLDMALQRFTRRTAEAANGTGEARDALREMGIQLRDSNGRLRSTDALLADVADALAQTEDAGTRTRLAFKLFDSEGVGLVNTLSGGSEALARMREQARELGVVIDDALVTEVSLAKDNIAALERATKSYQDQLALELTPQVESATEAWTAFNRKLLEVIRSFKEISSFEDFFHARGPLFDTPSLAEMFGIRRDPEGTGLEGSPEVGGRRAGQRGPANPPILPPGRPVARPNAEPFVSRKPTASAKAPEVYGPTFEEFARAREEAQRAVDRITDANLRAQGKVIELIAVRRDREIAALNDLALSEEEKAAARVAINETAATDIARAHDRTAAAAARAADDSLAAFARFGETSTRILADLLIQGEFTADSLIRSFTRLAADQSIQQLFAMLSGGGAGSTGGGSSGGGLLAFLGFGGGGGTAAGSGGGSPLIGAGVIHGGGTVGADAFPMRSLPAAAFVHAPRLHRGLFGPDEFPAVLERGETVTPKGGGNIIVNNYGGAQVEARRQGSDTIIDIDAAVATTIARQGSLAARAVDARVDRGRRVR